MTRRTLLVRTQKLTLEQHFTLHCIRPCDGDQRSAWSEVNILLPPHREQVVQHLRSVKVKQIRLNDIMGFAF